MITLVQKRTNYIKTYTILIQSSIKKLSVKHCKERSKCKMIALLIKLLLGFGFNIITIITFIIIIKIVSLVF